MATCDTCGRLESQEVKMYESKTSLMCCDCAAELLLLSHPELQPRIKSFKETIGFSTKDIYKHLSRSVIGQDRAKKVLSISLMNHVKRLVSDVKLEKNNVLLIGSTGTGKTLLAKELSEFLDYIPFGTADATSITQTGWAGDDPETVLLDLYKNCNGDVEKVEKGIVFIDEIDKVAHHEESHNESSNYGAQRGLLKLLEGSIVQLPLGGNRKNSAVEKMVLINTANILFICGGAFTGLEEIVKARLDKKSIGFTGEVEEEKLNLSETEPTTEDLQTYGFLSEFLGRLSSKAVLEDLSIHELRAILTKSKDSLVSQYTKIFDMDGVKLEFSSTGLEEIAKQALELKTGARGLKTVLEKVLFDYQYDYDEKELYITKNVVLEKLGIKTNNEFQNSDIRSRPNSL